MSPARHLSVPRRAYGVPSQYWMNETENDRTSSPGPRTSSCTVNSPRPVAQLRGVQPIANSGWVRSELWSTALT